MGATAFSVVAHPGLFALPFAILLLVSRPQTRVEHVALGVAGGFALWWLLSPGNLPDQVVRAAALFSALAFTVTTLRSKASVTHRALHAVAVAGAGVTTLLLLLGSSWGELRWWVSHQTGLTARAFLGTVLATTPVTAGSDSTTVEQTAMEQLQRWFAEAIPVVADFYPALLAVQLLIGIALGTALYQRVATRPRGTPPDSWMNFRFTEHLNWAAAAALIIVLLPKLATAKLAAGNLLVVSAALYAVRGIAVAAVGLQVAGGGGVFLTVLLAAIFLFLTPIVLAGAMLLGVLDTRLDLRRRWGTKTAA